MVKSFKTNLLSWLKTKVYVKTDVDALLNHKAPVNHTHAESTTSSAGFMSKTDKSKLDGIDSGANKTVVESSLSSTSTNPVQNKVINSALSGKANSSHSHSITDVTNLQSSLDSKAGTSIATTSANGLMSSSDKTKLNGIATGATKVTVDTSLSSSSTNPVQNKVINTALNDKTNINTRDFSFFLSDVILPEGSSIADKSITRSHVHDTIQIPYKQSTQEGYHTDTFNLENFDLFLSWSPNSLGTNSNIQFILLNPETNEKISVVCTPQQGRTWVDIVCDSGTNRTYDQKGTYGNVAGKYFGLIFKVRRDKLSYVLCDEDGNILPVYSISAGLDYPGIGPEHAYLNDIKRAKYTYITDDEAVNAFYTLTKIEGIIPALESSHAVAYAMKLAGKLSKEEIILVNLSGRGDKDLDIITSYERKGEI